MAAPFKLYSVHQAARIVNGEEHGKGLEDRGIFSVVTDSRKAVTGSLFVALDGERSDGHKHINQAVENGAVCILADKNKAGLYRDVELTGKSAVIRVDNPLASLQKLAEEYVSRFPSLIRIGITGSSGKTTTKEILAAIFSLSDPTVFTQGNLNSEIGLPLSMFSIRPEHKYGIFEMGINFKGEMDILARIFRPEYTVITNIGTAHTGPLGGEEGIVREKSRIFSYFSNKSIGFLPEEDRHLEYLKSACKDRFVLFGENRVSAVTDAEDLGLDGWQMKCGGENVRFSLPGRHNLSNLYAAVAVAEYFAIDPVVIRRGIESVSALPGRSRIIRSGITIIEDSYNANEDSLAKAMVYLSDLPWSGRKIAVLGSMKELGAASEKIHAGVGEMVLHTGIDAVFFYGEEMGTAYTVLREKEPGFKSFHFTNYSKLENSLSEYVESGDIVLLKGSRSMKLERLVDKLSNGEALKGYV